MRKNNGKNDGSGNDTQLSTAVKKFNWRLLLILAGNTVIFFGVYRVAMRYYYFEYVLGLYLALTALFSIGYVVYNRGFSRRGVTLEMLPDTMTGEEKQAFIDDGERRMKKSKWMLTVIFPLLLTFTFEVIELFVIEYFVRLFG